MSARRLGRRIGSLLVVATLAALPFIGLPADSQQQDFEWHMPAVTQLSVR
ncbi:hypothetical protein ACTMSW_15780 [Micromonospora sp. BQ11]